MESDLEACFKVLKNGGVILYPTDTVWGIGCDATNAKAVERIYQIKKRAETKSLIILLDDILKLDFYVENVPVTAFDLINNFNEPLTIIYPNAKNVAKNVIANDGSIAIRIVKDEFCKRLINLLNKPIVSTSANISREDTPLTFSKISDQIKNDVDYVVQYRQDKVVTYKPSTVIKISDKGDFETIRK